MHVLIDRGAPIAPIPRAAPVIDIQHQESALLQDVVEHILAVVSRPLMVHVLKISRAMPASVAFSLVRM